MASGQNGRTKRIGITARGRRKNGNPLLRVSVFPPLPGSMETVTKPTPGDGERPWRARPGKKGAKQVRIGDHFRFQTQRYTCVDLCDYETRDGRRVTLRVLETACPECGRQFRLMATKANIRRR